VKRARLEVDVVTQALGVSAGLEIILTPTRFFARVDGLRGTERCGMSSSYPWSVDFGAGELDHLGPLLCICGDECAEVGG
jgi:hypothetical protein